MSKRLNMTDYTKVICFQSEFMVLLLWFHGIVWYDFMVFLIIGQRMMKDCYFYKGWLKIELRETASSLNFVMQIILLCHWYKIILLLVEMNSFNKTMKSFLEWIHSKYLSWPCTSGAGYSDPAACEYLNNIKTEPCKELIH